MLPSKLYCGNMAQKLRKKPEMDIKPGVVRALTNELTSRGYDPSRAGLTILIANNLLYESKPGEKRLRPMRPKDKVAIRRAEAKGIREHDIFEIAKAMSRTYKLSKTKPADAILQVSVISPPDLIGPKMSAAEVNRGVARKLKSVGYNPAEVQKILWAGRQMTRGRRPVLGGRIIGKDAEAVRDALNNIKRTGRERETLASLVIRGPEAPTLTAIPKKVKEGKHEYLVTMGRNKYRISSTKPFRSKGLVKVERSRIADFAKEFIARPSESSITSIKLVQAGGERRLSPAERREFTKEYFERYKEMRLDVQKGRIRPKPRIKIASG